MEKVRSVLARSRLHDNNNDMNTKNIRIAGTALIITTLAVGIVSCSAWYLDSRFQVTRINAGNDVPFTFSQIKTMMRYHGAIVARFDGTTWWFLKNGKWIALTNDGALSYAFKAQSLHSNSM